MNQPISLAFASDIIQVNEPNLQLEAYLAFEKITNNFEYDKINHTLLYPDELGGLYINEDNYLVIQLKEIDETIKEKYNKLSGNSAKIIFKEVQNSYNELIKINEDLMSELMYEQNIVSFYIDVIENEIVIGVENYNPNEVQNYSNRFSPIRVVKDSIIESTSNMYGGDP